MQVLEPIARRNLFDLQRLKGLVPGIENPLMDRKGQVGNITYGKQEDEVDDVIILVEPLDYSSRIGPKVEIHRSSNLPIFLYAKFTPMHLIPYSLTNMRIPLLILLVSLTTTAKTGIAQSTLYFEWIHQADSLTNRKEYKKAAAFYDKALPQANRKYITYDWYNAVCIYALAGKNDKAFQVLTQLANMSRFYEGRSLLADADLTSLHQDTRWENLRRLFLHKDSVADLKINHTLKSKLRHAFEEDQRYRRPLDSVIQKYGANSPQVDSLENNMAKADSQNLILVRSILDKYGWLGPDIIGGIGSSTLFAVIQHADLAPGVQEKYLPYLRRAVEKGDADPSDLALLEDRILVGQHKPQLYGSQIKTNDQGISAPFPIADSSHVDSRRAKMGLGPLKYYVQLFNPTPTAQ